MTATLDEVLERPGNNFNMVRVVAATAVILSHSFMLVYHDPSAQPLSWGPYNLGANAVNVFFVLSGILLARSIERHPNWRAFALARVLRILPALLWSGVVVAVLAGLLATTLPLSAFFFSSDALLYPLYAATQFEGAQLPEVFVDSPNPGEINRPLWTIKYELTIYALFLVAVMLGLGRSRRFLAALTVALGVALLALQSKEHQLGPLFSVLRFSFCFALGTCAYHYRKKLPLNGLVAVAGLVVGLALGPTPLAIVAWVFAAGYAALVLGSLHVKYLTGLANRLDISFGLYLYGWPIQQYLLQFEPMRSSLVLHVLLSLLLAGAFAYVSARYIEVPAMRLRRRSPVPA